MHEELEVLNYEVKKEDHPKEIARFKEALRVTFASKLRRLGKALPKILGEKEAGIFDAHLMVLGRQSID